MCGVAPRGRKLSCARVASTPQCACHPRCRPWALTLPAFLSPASPGYILHPMSCHACGAPLSQGARFCHKCGAAVATAGPTGWRAGFPWAIAGAALGALVTLLAIRGTGGGSASSGEQGAATSGQTAQLRAPDISQMSPQERANRLFNRVMILAEAGKNDSVHFFLPMALGAYSQLPTLDADARYHLELLQLPGADPSAALAQADTIQRATPTHLFIYVLRAHAYRERGDARQEARAYPDFLPNEPAESANNHAEHADHSIATTRLQ